MSVWSGPARHCSRYSLSTHLLLPQSDTNPKRNLTLIHSLEHLFYSVATSSVFTRVLFQAAEFYICTFINLHCAFHNSRKGMSISSRVLYCTLRIMQIRVNLRVCTNHANIQDFQVQHSSHANDSDLNSARLFIVRGHVSFMALIHVDVMLPICKCNVIFSAHSQHCNSLVFKFLSSPSSSLEPLQYDRAGPIVFNFLFI